MDVPRWLKLQEEIDYLYFVLSEIRRSMPETGIEEMIDEVTGYEAERRQEIRETCVRIKALKQEWSKETGKPASTDMEDQIIKLTE